MGLVNAESLDYAPPAAIKRNCELADGKIHDVKRDSCTRLCSEQCKLPRLHIDTGIEKNTGETSTSWQNEDKIRDAKMQHKLCKFLLQALYHCFMIGLLMADECITCRSKENYDLVLHMKLFWFPNFRCQTWCRQCVKRRLKVCACFYLFNTTLSLG
jgi:hypothetical protein